MKKADVIAYFSNQAKIAAVLGVARASVSQWGEVIPEKQALRLERITDGALKYDPSLYLKAA